MHFLFIDHSDSCTCTNKSCSADSWANLVYPFIPVIIDTSTCQIRLHHHFGSSLRELSHIDRTTSSGLSLNDNWVAIYVATVQLRTESLKELTPPTFPRILYISWCDRQPSQNPSSANWTHWQGPTTVTNLPITNWGVVFHKSFTDPSISEHWEGSSMKIHAQFVRLQEQCNMNSTRASYCATHRDLYHESLRISVPSLIQTESLPPNL